MRFDKRPSKKNPKGFTWSVVVDYTTPTGQKKRIRKSGFNSKKEAAACGKELELQIQQEQDLSGSIKTLDIVFREFIDCNTDMAANTIATYQYQYQKHISSVLGNKPIKTIHFGTLQGFMNSLDAGISVRKMVKAILNSVMKFAVKCRYIVYNPVQDLVIKAERPKLTEPEILTDDDFDRICMVLERIPSKDPMVGRSYVIGMYLGFYLGLRIREALALEWDDINFDARTVRITKQVCTESNSKGKIYVTDRLKTEASYSVLPLCEPLKEILEDWRMENPNDLVLCSTEGDIIIPRSYQYKLRRASQKAGIHFHYHMLRHCFITKLSLAGVNSKALMELARHSSITTTLGVYTDINGEQLRSAVDMIYPKNAPIFPVDQI